MNRIIYVPLELKARELHARVLLACEMSRRGWDVVIARSDMLHFIIEQLPPGVYLCKNLSKGHVPLNRRIRAAGHVIVGQDEEAGIVVSDFGTFWRKRIDDELLALLDACFLWSESQLSYALGNAPPALRERFHFTGSPRLDLMRDPYASIHREGSRALKERYGEYLLMSSNFAGANGPTGIDGFREKLTTTYGAVISADEIEAFLGCATRSLEDYCRSLPYVARELGIPVVIRPYPTERGDAWAEVVDGKHVFEDRRGTLAAAVAGARAVIHHGCTAAIEANLLRVPAVYYDESGVREKCPHFFQDVSAALSRRAHSKEELLEACRALVEAGRVDPELAGRADQMFFPDRASAAANISHQVATRHRGMPARVERGTLVSSFLRSAVRRPKQALALMDRMVAPERTPGSRVITKKCAALDAEDVGDLIQALERLAGFEVGRARQLFWNVVGVPGAVANVPAEPVESAAAPLYSVSRTGAR